MKTLLQHRIDQAAQEARQQEEDRQHREDLARAANAVPREKWVDETARTYWRKMLGTRPIGIACDNCGTELVTDNLVLASVPPQQKVACIGCGFTSSVRC